MAVTVTASDINAVFSLLHKKLADLGVETVNINTDYYWLISTDQWDNLESDPQPVVGSLVDDWESLRKVLEGQHPATFVDFERFASVLRALSETLNPTTES